MPFFKLKKKKYSILAVILLVVIIVISLFFFANPLTKTSEFSTFTKTTLTIGNENLVVYLADTEELRTQGLSGTTLLPQGYGMLFVFPQAGKYSFWMKDMHYAIDIAWINENGEVGDISENLSPDTYPQTFAPIEAARWVLEVPAGYLKKKNIQIGTFVIGSDEKVLQ